MKARLKYEQPEMNIIYLTPTDVLTTSSGSFDGEWVPIEFGNSDDPLI